MTDEVIPGDVREFILRNIDSIAHLEALLLLRRSPDEQWDIEKTAQRLYAKPQEIAQVLTQLCTDGFLTCREGIYQYEGRDQAQRQMVARLAELYARHLIPITNLVHSKPRRIREFADAFKFRKEP